MHRLSLPFLLALVVAGCSASRTAEAPAVAEQPHVTEEEGGVDTPVVQTPEAHASETTLEALQAYVRAHEAESLPGAEIVARYPDAEHALVHLAQGEPTIGYRARALGLLAHAFGPSARALLLATATDAEARPLLRAGAIAGLGGAELETDDEAYAVVEAALSDPDVRVRLEAVRALRRVARAADALNEASEVETEPSVRALLDER